MGFVLLVLDGLVDVGQWVGKNTIKLGKGLSKIGGPALKKGAESLRDWIGSHVSENRIELKPVNISLVAPSGFGKTTLISTIMKEMDLTLQRTDKDRSWELNVRPKNEEDEARLRDNNKKIVEAINSGNGRIASVSIEGSGAIASYNYEIVLTAPGNRKELIQPFCMMDIPGGWINPDNRLASDVSKQWDDFEKHLHDSKILWIPIDAVALMEARTTKERDMQSKLMDISDVSDLAVEWAKYRTDDEQSCICFAPLKCETYKLFDDEENVEFRKKFNDMIKQIVEDVSRAKGTANIKMYYTPVETIGCIKKISTSWGTTWVNKATGAQISTSEEAKLAGANAVEKNLFSADYTITGNHRDIKGANLLLNKVYEYAYKQIVEMEKYDEKLLDSVGFLDKKKAELAVNSIKKAIQPIVDELAKYTESAKNLEEIIPNS